MRHPIQRGWGVFQHRRLEHRTGYESWGSPSASHSGLPLTMYKSIHYPHSYGTIATLRELPSRGPRPGLVLRTGECIFSPLHPSEPFCFHFFQLWLLLCFFLMTSGRAPYRIGVRWSWCFCLHLLFLRMISELLAFGRFIVMTRHTIGDNLQWEQLPMLSEGTKVWVVVEEFTNASVELKEAYSSPLRSRTKTGVSR